MNYNYLKDSSFLQELIGEKVSEQFIKDPSYKPMPQKGNEKPLKEIQGKTTGGNLSLNGSSSIRRTGSISLCVDENDNDLTNIEHLFSINKKVKIDIGLLNTTKRYINQEVLWFPLGVFIIANPSISHGDNGITISLSLKDKMSMLNGDCGGVIPASTVFHEYEILDPETGEYVVQKPTIVQIIQELVNHFGGEQLGKIIISDIDSRIKKVMKWTGSNPLYYYKEVDEEGNTSAYYSCEDLGDYAKVYETGEDIGYIYSDFYYPGELIANAGESVCTVLDKIKNTLGNFEYYYDVYGNFIFQEIKNYLNTSKSTVDLNNINGNNYLVDRDKGKIAYSFEDGTLISSFSNNPQYSMIKNDFIVWGKRETTEGLSVPIRYHLAIDSKPKVGNTYFCYLYTDPEDDILKAKVAIEYSTSSSFPKVGEMGRIYLDVSTNQVYHWKPSSKEYELLDIKLQQITTSDWRTELYLSGAMGSQYGTNSNYYYTELENEWSKLYDIQNGTFHQDVLNAPSEIDFYLDMIDSTAAISELSVASIGRRTKVVNDEKINCIFEADIPNYVIIESGQVDTDSLKKECIEKGQDWILVETSIYDRLAMGGSANSAFKMVQDLLYQHTSYNESITVQVLPIFFLEPNIRIGVRDSKSGIYGEYMIKTISLSFDITGKMSLSCTRALDKI